VPLRRLYYNVERFLDRVDKEKKENEDSERILDRGEGEKKGNEFGNQSCIKLGNSR